MNGTEIRSSHPRLSRETRHLLLAAFISLVALWVLARIRFPDRPVTPNPIPPLLTQIASRPAFGDLASEIARLQTRLASALVNVSSASAAARTDDPLPPAAGLRLQPDIAVTWLPPARPGHPDLIARDRPTGLSLVRVARLEPTVPVPWAPDRLDSPRYFASTALFGERIAMRPVFVGSLRPLTSPGWSGPVWAAPSGSSIEPGSLLFTEEGDLAGLAVLDGGDLIIVPGEVLLADAQRLLGRAALPPGHPGIQAQALTPPLAKATGAESGVVVNWVDPDGPAAARIRVGDVIEAIGEMEVRRLREWDVRTGRMQPGEVLPLRVRRAGEVMTIEITAAPVVLKDEGPASLGIAMRVVSGVGAEITSVEPGSAADVAGLLRGDLIRMAGGTSAPTPAQVRRAFAAAEQGAPILLAIARGNDHRVVALAK